MQIAWASRQGSRIRCALPAGPWAAKPRVREGRRAEDPREPRCGPRRRAIEPQLGGLRSPPAPAASSEPSLFGDGSPDLKGAKKERATWSVSRLGARTRRRARAHDGRRRMVIQRSNHRHRPPSTPAKDGPYGTGREPVQPAENTGSHPVSGRRRQGDVVVPARSRSPAGDPAMHAQVGNLSEVTLFSVISRMLPAPLPRTRGRPVPTSALESPLYCRLQHASNRRLPRPVRARSPRRRGD